MKYWALAMGLFVSVAMQGQNPNWVAPSAVGYTSTATAVTAIYLNGVPSSSAGDQIAVFSGTELRGLSTAVDIGGDGYRHFITIYSNVSAEVMTIKVYHQATDLVYDVAVPLEFETQRIFGAVDAPLPINIYDDNDAPIFLNVVPAQVTLEGVAFEEIDLLDYLIQPDNQGIQWSFVANPNLTVNLSGSVLQVQGSPGFTGTTSLTVRATETPLATSNKQGNPSHHMKALGAAQFAQRTISFHVTPAYAGPRWTTIPGEAILIGGQFAPVDLHDFENQYTGPAIRYDYRPIIVESAPAEQEPSWIFTGNFATSMSVIATVNYTPKYQFDHPDDILAAYVGGVIRGVATRDTSSGLYFLHISGSVAEQGEVTIRFYSGVMKKEFELEDEFDFRSNQIVGSIQNPYALEFAPIVPVVSDDPIVGGVYVMPVEVVDETYIGTEFFEFYASDPDYPETLSDTTVTSFCVFPVGSDLPLLFADNDGDGFGDPDNAIAVCGEVPGYVTNDDDCDDTSPVDPAIMITIAETSAVVPDDGFICANDDVTLTAAGGTDYMWSTGAMTPAITIMPSEASIYRVTATRTNLGVPCKGVAIVGIGTEGRVVTTSANDGPGSLRSVIDCLVGGDTLSFDQPVVTFSTMTAPIVIDKEVSILGQSMSTRPEIKVDFSTMSTAFEVLSGQRLNIIDTDFSVINGGAESLLSGSGSVFIQGRTEVRE